MSDNEMIEVYGARVHNLKNIDGLIGMVEHMMVVLNGGVKMD